MHTIFLFFRQNKISIYRILLFLIAIILLVIAFPKEGKFKYEFQKGRPWMHNDLIASYNFAILKADSDIQTERELIEAQIKPYFNYNQELTDSQFERLKNLFETEWQNKYVSEDFYAALKEMNWEYCKSVFDSVST